MFNRTACTIAGIIFGSTITGGVAIASTAHHEPPTPRYMTHQLAEEDSLNGWWNDGSGHPFHSVSVPLLVDNGRGNTHFLGRVDCHFYYTRIINGSRASVCQARIPVTRVNRDFRFHADLLDRAGARLGSVNCLTSSAPGEPDYCTWLETTVYGDDSNGGQ